MERLNFRIVVLLCMMMNFSSIVYGQVPSGYTIVNTHNDDITWYEAKDNNSGKMVVAYNNRILCTDISEAFYFHGFIMAKLSGWHMYYVFDKQGKEVRFGITNFVYKVEIVGDNLFFFYEGVYDENLNKIADREDDFSKCGNIVYLKTKENGKYGIYDLVNKKQVLPSQYKGVDVLAESGLCEINEDGKRSIYDLKNEQQIPKPTNYDKVWIMKVRMDGEGIREFRYNIKKDDKQGVCDINGKEIISPNHYDYVDNCNVEDGHFYIVKKDGKSGACDQNGREIMAPSIYDEVDVKGKRGGFYYIVKKDKKIGVCNMNGREIIAPKYEDISLDNRDDNSYFKVKLNGMYGVCDLNGREIIAPKYDRYIFLHNRDDNSYFDIKLNGMYGVCDLNGREIIEPRYENISLDNRDDNSYYKVKLNGMYGVCDLNGREIIEPKYEYVSLTKSEDNYYFEVKLNGKKGICDRNGHEILAPKYDEILKLSGYYQVRLNGKEGAFDLNWREIIAPKYESLICSNGVFKYKDTSGKWISLDIDVKGNVCIDPDYAYEKYFDEGREYFAKAKYGQAAKSYKKALEFRQYPAAYYNVGVSYYNMHNYDDAITYFQYCINSHPDASLEKEAQDRIGESRQYMAQQEARREEVAAAIIGGIIGFAEGMITGSMGVPANDPDYQAWMNYRNSGLPGASTISFEDFKRANARAAANGYQIGSSSESGNNGGNIGNPIQPNQLTEDCSFCHGSGKCNSCNGTHRINYQFGSGTLECPNCKPDGRCTHCGGSGKVTKTRYY